MQDKERQAKELAAKLYVLHDHLRRYDPSAPIEGENGDMFIRFNDLIPILKDVFGVDLSKGVADGIIDQEDIEEALQEVGHTYCLTNEEWEEPQTEDPKLN